MSRKPRSEEAGNGEGKSLKARILQSFVYLPVTLDFIPSSVTCMLVHDLRYSMFTVSECS